MIRVLLMVAGIAGAMLYLEAPLLPDPFLRDAGTFFGASLAAAVAIFLLLGTHAARSDNPRGGPWE